MLNPGSGLPTLSGTILTPIGSFISASLFHVSALGGITYGGVQSAPTLAGVSSIVALLGIAALVLVALYQFLRWQQAQQ
jgi:hypothetical protein